MRKALLLVVVVGCGGGASRTALELGDAAPVSEAAASEEDAPAGQRDAAGGDSASDGSAPSEAGASDVGSDALVQDAASADADAGSSTAPDCGPCPMPSVCGGNGDPTKCSGACLETPMAQSACAGASYPGNPQGYPPFTWGVGPASAYNCSGTPYTFGADGVEFRDGGRSGCGVVTGNGDQFFCCP